MKKYLLISCIVIASCAKPPKEPYLLPDNAMRLLTGDSTKTWKLARRFNNGTRMNMGDCFLAYRQTYRSDMTMHDNNGENADCGETLKATWKFIKDQGENYYIKLSSEQLPALMHIDEDYKFFKITHLSEEQMTLQFNHKQFSNKTSLITAIYVPEHASVEDRDFHH